MSVEGSIVFSQEGHIATLRLNRPEKLNTMTPAMGKRMVELVGEINADDAIRVVILTGTGERAFSAGGDAGAGRLRTNWGTAPHRLRQRNHNIQARRNQIALLHRRRAGDALSILPSVRDRETWRVK
jgi:enoyl-CoA hydratase/carnithine racemase